MAKPLVIVESPAKARTIGRFLGAAYDVEASVGHVRDLPSSAAEVPAEHKGESWARLGVNVDAGFEPLYVVPAEKRAQVKKLRDLVRGASAVYLATDEDREGESISWHLYEVLKLASQRPKLPVHRLVFHEITDEAIRAALAHPRQVDLDQVKAQETRRILDRLYGYEVSPLLWKKVRPALSAGRVQSVAVRLIVQRERERLAFRSAGWWDVSGTFGAPPSSVDAGLVEWRGQRVASGKDFAQDGSFQAAGKAVLLDEAGARAVVASLEGGAGRVDALDEKPYTDRPAPPFTTSTLQQEANRKLRWTARKAMQVAQTLYETGWITYMRTDSTTLSDEAIGAARSLIAAQYGSEYVPSAPRVYATKVKNAQEAHEAVRPAGNRFRSLDDAQRELGRDEARLYELIWKRTVACQMKDARGSLLSLRIRAGEALFEARGKTIAFPGYRRAYVEGSDNPDAELADQERILPAVKVGDRLPVVALDAKGHQTQPPARLTEASLVKELEARGIGRPSTYASIIDTILQREYVFKKSNALVPTFTAFAVTRLLEDHLGGLVDYDFTAQMEEQLDDIALGKVNPQAYLAEFYSGGGGLKSQLQQADSSVDPRTVCTFELGKGADGEAVAVRVGRYGPFLSAGEATVDIPDDLPPDELDLDRAVQLLQERKEGPRVLGVDARSGSQVFLMVGRFGPYVQLGEAPAPPAGKGRGKAKAAEAARPPRASLLKGMEPDDVDLETALALLSLPRSLGRDPRTDEEVLAANGRFGPYVKRGTTSRSVPPHLSVLQIGLQEAMRLLDEAPKRGPGRTAIAELGIDPQTGRPLRLMEGRFGPYVTDGETNASLPKGTSPDGFELAAAISLIRARELMPKKPGRGRAAGARRSPTGKAAASRTKAAATPSAQGAAKKAPAAAKATRKAPKTASRKAPATKKGGKRAAGDAAEAGTEG
jgi:DNA topoisomerase I